MFPLLGRLFRRNGPTGPRQAPPPGQPERSTASAPQLTPPTAPAVEHYKRGNTLRNAGRLEDALASYDAAVALSPEYAHAHCNRGAVLQALRQPQAALDSYERAIALDPADAMAHYNRALVLQEESRWDEALASYNAAVAIDPQFADAQYNRALALLYCGDYVNGWRAFEWRWKNARRLSIGERRNYPEPLWLGRESLAGKRILLHAEGGFGDTLQFCRYATLLAGRGATVLLEAQAPLLNLLARIPGVSSVHAQGAALPELDFQCPMMSLPFACATTLEGVPGPSPYLVADADSIARWEVRLGPRVLPRVGLVWSGNPNNWLDQRRSISLADWTPHLPPGFSYYRLQKDVRAADRATLGKTPAIVSFDDGELDFDSTAALCACMDVVLCVDTSVLHLAAALGRPTWGLLAANPDWRWLRARQDSPWYPTLTLYRQEFPGEWTDVFRRLAADLRRHYGCEPGADDAAGQAETTP